MGRDLGCKTMEGFWAENLREPDSRRSLEGAERHVWGPGQVSPMLQV